MLKGTSMSEKTETPLQVVTLYRRFRDYGDILDVAHWLGKQDYGSASHAVAIMVKRSPIYIDALLEMQILEEAEKPRLPRTRRA
jgi:hypothetical protein